MKYLSALFIIHFSYNCQSQSSWQQCNNGTCNTFIRSFIETPASLIASGTCSSADSGLTWSPMSSGEFAFCMVETSAGLFAGSDTAIYFSSNWGASWALSFATSGPLNFIYDMGVSNDTVFAASRGSGVLISPDQGVTWNISNTGLPDDSTYSILVKNNSIYVGMLKHGIYKSMDGGNSWSSINNGIPANATIAGIATDGTNIYAAAGNAVYISSDEGASWMQSPGAPTSNREIIVVGNSLILGCFTFGSNPGLFRSLDQGQTWQPFDNGLPSGCPYGISSIYEGTSFVYLGMESQCGSIYRMEKSQFLTSTLSHSDENKLYNISPNPTISDFIVSGNNNYVANIKIFDLAGRLLINEMFRDNLTISTSKLDSGTYYYSITGGTTHFQNGKLFKL